MSATIMKATAVFGSGSTYSYSCSVSLALYKCSLNYPVITVHSWIGHLSRECPARSFFFKIVNHILIKYYLKKYCSITSLYLIIGKKHTSLCGAELTFWRSRTSFRP